LRRRDLALHISSTTALLGSTFVAGSFVGLLHLWKLFGVHDEDRDDPGTIKRRFASATLCCVCSGYFIIALCEPAAPGEQGLSVMQLLGLQLEGFLPALSACLSLTALLFAGPLVQQLLASRDRRGKAQKLSKEETTRETWIKLRNYVLAPAAEEVAFRACLCRLWLGADLPPKLIIFCTPCWFSLAHAHHYLEHVRRHGDTAGALLQVLFQVFYTSLFGTFAAFLLLRTGSTIVVTLIHTFCNHMGFPDLSWISWPRHPLYSKRAYIAVVYIVGVIAFGILLAPLTEGFASPFKS